MILSPCFSNCISHLAADPPLLLRISPRSCDCPSILTLSEPPCLACTCTYLSVARAFCTLVNMHTQRSSPQAQTRTNPPPVLPKLEHIHTPHPRHVLHPAPITPHLSAKLIFSHARSMVRLLFILHATCNHSCILYEQV